MPDERTASVMTDFDFDGAIMDAQRQIDRITAEREKRMEFWRGYKFAMEELRDHL